MNVIMRKLSRKALIKKIDHVVSEITIKREPQCVMCGSTEKLGNGHIFSRKHLATRFDVTPDGNCHTQCWKHNYGHVYSTYPYNNWYVKKFGIEKFDALYQRWNTVSKIKTYELQELLDSLNDTTKTIFTERTKESHT